MFAVLAIALIAVGVGVVGWFRPPPAPRTPLTPAAPTYPDRQVADARAAMCAAFEQTQHAVSINSARDKGTDPAQQLAVAVNARQALLAGSEYLLTTLGEEPATPTDIAEPIRKLANLYQKLTVGLLADVTDPELELPLRAGDEATSTIERLCK